MIPIAAGDGFSGWHALNDTIMGGRSQGECRTGPDGLSFQGVLIADGGGFISCRSPLFSPPLDLSGQKGIELVIGGEGRRFKLAIACGGGLQGLTELIPGGLRWVTEFATEPEGMSRCHIPFSSLRPSVRAKPVGWPMRFEPSRLTRLQVLHSRFGDDGRPNAGFRAGPISFRIESLSAYD